MWLTICTGIVGYVREGKFKRWLNYHVSIMCFGVLSSALSAVITYHNPENRPKCGICVANHTSPIDVLVLACDNSYALVGFGVLLNIKYCVVLYLHPFCSALVKSFVFVNIKLSLC
jgi:hypothetical protein